MAEDQPVSEVEGVIVRLPDGQAFKAFVEDDDVPKSLQVNA